MQITLLWNIADRKRGFFLVLEGEVEIFHRTDSGEHVMVTHGRGHYGGETATISGPARRWPVVLGHEMSHVANGDMVTLALIQGVGNTFVFFLSRVIGQWVDRAVFRNERGHGPVFWITTMIAQMVLGVLAMIIVMWFSRWREFRADSGGAKLAGRDKMIGALERLGASVQQDPMPEQLQAFGIAGKPSGLARLFMSHPPLEERIAALRALYT